ncbi:putative maltose permease [Aspergillus nomiae NRRL 13137]|uniref:Putative maltose permease n=1 Tax=Aspergillus nomiae NRRL (strain ATCC 15546 / NRRL 13137 / CBS 260.88 / M93) TaxID=1509407 RepID=A0A0L1JFH5_ASPN3|nr:putative maltose permease [Aspergillus nomiae NRRL 13137]KNG90481.1 putative maltose permease [Aspergillus nomiae NRRL 13137]
MGNDLYSLDDGIKHSSADHIENSTHDNDITNDLTSAKKLFNDAREATEAEHNLTLTQALKLYPQAVGWSVLVSAACIMEGYDMAVIGQLFAQESFQKAFGVPSHDGYQITAPWQTALGNGGYIGTIFGILLNGYITERIGMKKTLVLAYIALTGFTFILVFGQTKALLLVGQILCGLPWGVFTATAPTYASEVCPVVLRGYLTTFINMTWVIGQLIAAGVFRGVQGMEGRWAYDIPFALQWIWPVPLCVGLLFCPESPWWLLRQGRLEEAEHSLRRLSPAIDPKKTLAMMIRTDEQEQELDSSSYWDCVKGVDRRRTEIALISWPIQVFAGISMNQYNTYFFQQAGVSGSTAFDISIGYYGLGFVGTLIAWFLMTHYGRRTIFIGGLALMCITMLTIGFAALAPESNNAAVWAQSILLVIWVFLYDGSVGPLAFCIVSEVGSTRLRAKTVALGRCSFYFWFIIFGVATPYMLNPEAANWKGKTFFLYGGTCFLSMVWAYFRLPEMKDRTYEELDILFRTKTSARKFASTHVNPYSDYSEA